MGHISAERVRRALKGIKRKVERRPAFVAHAAAIIMYSDNDRLSRPEIHPLRLATRSENLAVASKKRRPHAS